MFRTLWTIAIAIECLQKARRNICVQCLILIVLACGRRKIGLLLVLMTIMLMKNARQSWILNRTRCLFAREHPFHIMTLLIIRLLLIIVCGALKAESLQVLERRILSSFMMKPVGFLLNCTWRIVLLAFLFQRRTT